MSSKNLPGKGLAAGVYLSEAPSPPMTSYPHLHTVYVYTCILINTGKGEEGGRDEPERRLEGQLFTKLGRNYQHDWMYLQSINCDNHLPQSPFTGHENILLWCLYR